MLELCSAWPSVWARVSVAASSASPNHAVAKIPAKHCEFILLRETHEQLLWNDNVYKNAEARFRAPDVSCCVTLLESCRCMEYRRQTGGRPKLFRMTSFAKADLQPLWNDILDKKVGGGGRCT